MKRLLKARTGLTVLLIAAISFAAYYGISAFLTPNLVLEKERGLEQYGVIEVRAWPEGDAFHLGDSISYFIEVKYDAQEVEEIDKSSIDKNLVFEPFEILSESEREFNSDSRTKVFLREYKIQLVLGETGKTYFFPPVSLRYKLKNSAYFDKKLSLQPIPIGSRFPADTKGIELKSIDGVVSNKSRQHFPFIIMGVGIFCGAWVVPEVFRKITKRKREVRDFLKRLEGIQDLYQAYQDLAGKEDEPKIVLHQAHQILRELLSRKEGIDWPEPSLEKIPPVIHSWVNRTLEITNKAYGQEVLDKTELQEVLQGLKKIFDFYVGNK